MSSSCEQKRITGVVDGQIVSVSDKPVFTSASTPWAGFLLEAYSAETIRQDVWWGWHKSHACLITRGCLSFRMKQGGFPERHVAKAGSVCVFPSGFGETRFAYEPNRFQSVCVELDTRALSCVGMTPKIGIYDESLAAILNNMRLEIAKGCPSGTLYGESLSFALASYIQGNFSRELLKRRPIERLSQVQIQLLKEYICSNIGQALTTAELATLVNTSRRHFSRLFLNTFGTTPHHYVVVERIARAKELILLGSSFVEIAQVVGFSSQSHFSTAFRKEVGISPGRYRMEVGGVRTISERHRATSSVV